MRPVMAIAVGAGLGLAVGLLAARLAPRAGVRRVFPAATGAELRTDEALVETFPASDPPAAMSSLVSGAPARPR